ncbi:MAG: hypothetical protein ACLRRU_03160 [Faecalibacterium sp.]
MLPFFAHPGKGEVFRSSFAAAMWLFSFLTAGWLHKVSYLLSMLICALFGPAGTAQRPGMDTPGAVEAEEPEVSRR